MKKLTLLLLLMVSTNVMAEWIEVGSNDDVGLTVYADFGTIKRKGHKVKMWKLYDYKTVQKSVDDRFLSSTSRDEYDCEEETIVLLDWHWYSGNMINGEIVHSNTNIKEETQSVIPESMGETLFKIVCGKK